MATKRARSPWDTRLGYAVRTGFARKDETNAGRSRSFSPRSARSGSAPRSHAPSSLSPPPDQR
jgi:hypothetical protein